MNWNQPITAKQFAILLWGPILVIALIVGALHWRAEQRAAEARRQAAEAERAKQEMIRKAHEELHGNIDAVKQQQRNMAH